MLEGILLVEKGRYVLETYGCVVLYILRDVSVGGSSKLVGRVLVDETPCGSNSKEIIVVYDTNNR